MDTFSFFDEKPMRLPHKIIATLWIVFVLIGTVNMAIEYSSSKSEAVRLFSIAIGIGIVGVTGLVVGIILTALAIALSGFIIDVTAMRIYRKIRRWQGVSEDTLEKEVDKIFNILQYVLFVAALAVLVY